MRLKTFTAHTMPEALRLIKKDLGSDAIILSTRKIKHNGKNGLEITAAVDQPNPELPVRHHKKTAPLAPHPTPHDASTDFETLNLHGVDSTLVESITAAQTGLSAAQFTPKEGIEMVLGKRLDIQPLSRTFKAGQVHVFVGPTGAGKTTFTGKVAVWGKKGQQSVGLLSLDTQKIGGVEPLHVLADALGEKTHVIQTPEDLKPLRNTLGKRQLILVDTPGLNPYNPRAINTFAATLKQLCAEPAVHLVLPAGLSLTELKNAVTAFKKLNFQDVIFTKLDETASLGNVVNVLAMNLAGGTAGNSPSMSDGPMHLTSTEMAAALMRPPTHILNEEAHP